MSELKAYQVGDCDVVAAYTPEQAIEVLSVVCGYPHNETFDFTLEEVKLVSDGILDARQFYDLDEAVTINLETSLREDLALMTEPQYIYGWE